MIKKLMTKNLDPDIEFVRVILVQDLTDAVFLKHLIDGSSYNSNADMDGDISYTVLELRAYDVKHVISILEDSAVFADILERVNMAHEYKWADGIYDKLEVAVIAFDKATS